MLSKSLKKKKKDVTKIQNGWKIKYERLWKTEVCKDGWQHLLNSSKMIFNVERKNIKKEKEKKRGNDIHVRSTQKW